MLSRLPRKHFDILLERSCLLKPDSVVRIGDDFFCPMLMSEFYTIAKQSNICPVVSLFAYSFTYVSGDLRFLRQVQIKLKSYIAFVLDERVPTREISVTEIIFVPYEHNFLFTKLRHSGKLYPVGGITFLHMNRTMVSC